MPVQLVTDAWNQNTGADQDIDDYGPYALLEGSIVIRNGNDGRFMPTGGAHCSARRTNVSGVKHGYSQIVITASQLAGGIYCGPLMRGQSGVNSSYHVETAGTGAVYLSKCLAGTQTVLTGSPISAQAFAAGDILRLTADDNGADVILRVWRAPLLTPTIFTQIGTYTDVAADSPIMGHGFFGVFGYGSAATYGGGAWEAGDMEDAVGFPVAPKPLDYNMRLISM